MKREDRLSAGMTHAEVSRIYFVLRKTFEERRKKQREQEALLNSVIPNGKGQKGETK